MQVFKPAPLLPHRFVERCPICGKPSYSRDRIHPQCRVYKDGQPQTPKPKTGRARRRCWTKKCLKCGVQVHIHREICDCGHKFYSR